MWIDATLGGKRFGGYQTYSYSIEVAEDEDQIEISFELDNDNQQAGSVRIGKMAAKWLAHALIVRAENFATGQILKANIDGDEIQKDDK